MAEKEMRSFTDRVVEVHNEKGKALVRLARRNLQSERLPASRADAEDIVQDALLTTLTNGANKPIENIYAYMCTVITNRVRDESRRLGIADPVDVTDRSTEARKVLWVSDVEEDVAGKVDMEAALRSMSPQQRRLILLSKGVGYTHNEISQITGLHKGTVSQHIRRAHAVLASLVYAFCLVIALCAYPHLYKLRQETPNSNGPSDGEGGGVPFAVWFSVAALLVLLTAAISLTRRRRARQVRRDSDVLQAMAQVTHELKALQPASHMPTPSDYAARLQIPVEWITPRTLSRGRLGHLALTERGTVPLFCRLDEVSPVIGIRPGEPVNVIVVSRTGNTSPSDRSPDEDLAA